MWKKLYCIELYDKDDWLIDEWKFDTKQQQLQHYYNLLGQGYNKKDIVKLTRDFYY